jgi:hypothetical protein
MGKNRSHRWLEGFVERLGQPISPELKNALEMSPARFLLDMMSFDVQEAAFWRSLVLPLFGTLSLTPLCIARH